MLAGVVLVIIQSARGMRANAPYSQRDGRLSLFTVIVTDLQLVLGLALYTVLSPLTTQGIFPHFAPAMKDRVLRFWAVEHLVTMMLAIIAIHVVRVVVKKADNSALKHKRTFYGFALVLLLLWAGMPWPWKPYGRPLMGEAPSAVPSAPSGRSLGSLSLRELTIVLFGKRGHQSLDFMLPLPMGEDRGEGIHLLQKRMQGHLSAQAQSASRL